MWFPFVSFILNFEMRKGICYNGNLPLSKLAHTSMPESWQNNCFYDGNMVTVNSQIVFPVLLMFLTRYSDFSPSELYLKGLNWGRVFLGVSLRAHEVTRNLL